MAVVYLCFDDEGFHRVKVQGIRSDRLVVFNDGGIYLSAQDKWIYDENIIVEPDNEGGIFVVWMVLT